MLNKLDATLSSIAQENSHLFLNQDCVKAPSGESDTDCSQAIKTAHTILEFTTTLLTNSCTKDRYYSTEVNC